MSSDDKPSIAELAAMKRTFKTMTNDCGTLFDEDGDEIGTLEASQDGAFVAALTNAAPVLLEIVGAALAWRDQRAENLRAALMRTDAEIETEDQEVQRARIKKTADLASALERAIAKVRP